MTSPDTREDVEKILREAGRISGILRDLSDYIKKIFNPLFTTKKNRRGLGLSISNEIAGAHGGKLEVKTERGKGASFIITLPIISSLDEKEKGE